jgi:hypothetical protein
VVTRGRATRVWCADTVWTAFETKLICCDDVICCDGVRGTLGADLGLGLERFGRGGRPCPTRRLLFDVAL